MPSLTSLPLTARGPVSSLSKPIFTGSREAWARTAGITRRKARTTNPTRAIHRLTLFFVSIAVTSGDVVLGAASIRVERKRRQPPPVFGRRALISRPDARCPMWHDVVLALLCRNAPDIAFNGL